MSSRVQHRIYKPIPSGKTEDPDEYKWDGLHPVHIGDKLKDGRYRIDHKLRHGSFSTVWLARDEQGTRYVALMIVEAETSAENGQDSRELKVLRDLSKSPREHPGREYVLTLLDDFWIEGPNGRSICYVTEIAGSRVARPDWVTYKSFAWSQDIAFQLFQAVSYLHACNVAHGGKSNAHISSHTY
jgi:serine/threonine protein kinase